jgi:hypothetical protein
MRWFVLFRIWIVTADQLHQALRMHLVAVAVGSILLPHRTVVAAVGDRISLVRRLSGHRADV